MDEKKYNKKIGMISVDSGMCWIGDPCYIHEDDRLKKFNMNIKELPKTWGKNWRDFIKNIEGEENYKDGPLMKQFNHDSGVSGLGVCVQTGVGDGNYPVFAEILEIEELGRKRKIINKVWVDFSKYYEN